MFNTILACLDGSPMAEQMIPLVKKEAKRHGDKVLLFHVLDNIESEKPSPSLEPSINARNISKRREEALKYLENVAVTLSEIGITVEYQIVEGKADESIVKFAENNGVGLIVLTSHGKGGLGRLVFGSTAVYVLREASCPILLIKPQRPLNGPMFVRW